MFRAAIASGLALIGILILGAANSPVSEAKRAERSLSTLQFSANGHVLKFQQNDVYIGARDHAVKVEFVGSRKASISSQARDSTPSVDTIALLGNVTYTNLWDGISVRYEATRGGIVKSTYLLEPNAAVDNLRLRYNVTPRLDKTGGLIFDYSTGNIRESAPVAWQVKNGARVPVSVSFRLPAKREVGFLLGNYDRTLPLTIDPILQWNTFLGSAADDFALSIAADGNGNVYVAGLSNDSWGSPIRAHSAGSNYDAFVAKLDSNGALLWNTFLGSAIDDSANAIAVDGNNNVYVAGYSSGSWGAPLNGHAGADDAFVAELNTNGTLLWNTFLGSSFSDRANGITVDAANIYLTGYSEQTWGTPINPFTPTLRDAFAVKLSQSGTLVWSTFLGGPQNDFGNSVAIDGDGNVYIGGESNAGWGAPVRAYTARADGFAAKLSSSGQLLWNTFFGEANTDDVVYGIAVDSDANVYATGRPNFVSKLNPGGVVQWSTPTGGVEGSAVVVDASANVFVAARDNVDAVTTKLNSLGVPQWQVFNGGTGADVANGIAFRGPGSIYVAGSSNASWGAPIRPYSSAQNTPNDAFVFKLQDLPPPTVQFNSSVFSASEGPPPNGSTARVATIVVTRAGDSSTPVSVDYGTSDGTALQRTDYTTTSGTLTFAPGQTTRSFNIPLVDDGYVEDTETVNLTLSNPTGATFGNPTQAVLSIDDDEESDATTTPLDDASFFVRQHYFDFLSRTPDSGGFNFWVGEITQCGSDVNCLRTQRITVSNAFFYEQEYQQTGSYVVRLYRAAYGNTQPISNNDNNPQFPNENKKLVNYSAFSPDRARVRGGPSLAQTQLDLANAFVQRPQFLAKYAGTLSGPEYVDALLATLNTDIGVDLSSQRAALINLFAQGGRGAVLYRIADDNTTTNPINNRAFIDAEYNRAFVLTQYFGYLRRNPDIGGYIFWLGQVNSAPLRALEKQRAMVCSFITSNEYQLRFSPVAPHSNSECPQ